MNTHVRDNLRYLKGLDGTIILEDALKVSNDANCGIRLTTGETILDGDTGDNLRYNRAGDTWLFYVGGNEVARVDGGHIKALGSLKAGNDDVCALRLAAGETFLDGDTGDNLRYNRAGDTWLFYIGGNDYLRVTTGGLGVTGSVDASTYVEAGTNPAASGTVRIPNDAAINARNQANNADVLLLKLNTSDEAEIGATTRVTGAVDASTYLEAGTSPAQSGAVRIPNNDAIIARNQANDGDVALIKVNTSNEAEIGTTTRVTGAVDASTYLEAGTSPAQSGAVRIPNNDTIAARNQANNADVSILKLRTDNVAEVGASLNVVGSILTNDEYVVAAGMIQLYAAASPPTGWLLCDGSAVSRTTYATLFGVIGTTYGVGDGSTTFNVPNLKGRVPAGYDSGQTEFDALGETGGAKTHTLATTEIPGHTHGYNTFAGTQVVQSGTGVTVDYGSTALNTDLTGDGQAHNNLQPYIALNYIIKV